ncbi:MAG: nucleotide exchange factor GrpE [Candidatus Nanoarchaeia archaeon]|nr:nucleotide exchange factor GrpE [Candidatus Nanoarchaeia archaeon]
MTEKTKKTKENPEKQLQEYKDILQRLQAEFENYRKRTEKEREDIIKYGNQELIIKLLPIVDSFELALNNRKDKDQFVKGIELIYSQFTDTLEKEGVKKIKVLGEKFNPNIHEALLQEHSDKPEGTIIEELQSGYVLNNKVIRFAKVKLSNGGKK